MWLQKLVPVCRPYDAYNSVGLFSAVRFALLIPGRSVPGIPALFAVTAARRTAASARAGLRVFSAGGLAADATLIAIIAFAAITTLIAVATIATITTFAAVAVAAPGTSAATAA